jgi:hypothetical protein
MSNIIGLKHGLGTDYGVGSPSNWNAIIYAGSATTAAGSTGFAAVPTGTGSSYYVILQPIMVVAGPFYASGTKHASGVNFVGDASTTYDYLIIAERK